MRRLMLVVRSSKGALPLIVAAGVSVVDCGDSEPGSGRGTGGATDAAATGGFGTGGFGTGGSAGVISLTGGAGGTFAVGGSGGNPCLETFTVELPPEGVPALPGQICSATVEPVVSNRAARVTLQKLGPQRDLQSATGFIEIDPNLVDRVVGEPLIEVVDTTVPQLASMQVSAITAEAGGYSFDVAFPEPFSGSSDGYARMTVRVSLELDCEPPAQTRVVHAATDIHICLSEDDYTWVSSGDQCVVCRVIAEMAPSPIVPDKAYDELPLARAMRLRVIELARISNTVILLAENDGGEGLEYEWHASAGSVARLAPDVVAWTLSEGMPDPFIQAAVSGPSAVAVASFAFNEAA
jgi:hypothetical protein